VDSGLVPSLSGKLQIGPKVWQGAEGSKGKRIPESRTLFFARLPVRILILLPALSVLLSFQRSVLVTHKKTRPVTWGTVVEVGLISLTLWVFVGPLALVGAVAAALALLIGRLGCNLYLLHPVLSALRLKPRTGSLPGRII